MKAYQGVHIIIRFQRKVLAPQRHITLDISGDIDRDATMRIDSRERIAHVAPRHMDNRIHVNTTRPKRSSYRLAEMPPPRSITDVVEYLDAMAVGRHSGNAAESRPRNLSIKE